jgi:hypothetical protein
MKVQIIVNTHNSIGSYDYIVVAIIATALRALGFTVMTHNKYQLMTPISPQMAQNVAEAVGAVSLHSGKDHSETTHEWTD